VLDHKDRRGSTVKERAAIERRGKMFKPPGVVPRPNLENLSLSLMVEPLTDLMVEPAYASSAKLKRPN
jgi:hypothetical protein